MSRRFERFRHLRISALVVVIATLAATPLVAQIAVESEEISARFGVQGQLWANWSQDSTATVPGYTQNFIFGAPASWRAERSAATSPSFSRPIPQTSAKLQTRPPRVSRCKTRCWNGKL